MESGTGELGCKLVSSGSRVAQRRFRLSRRCWASVDWVDVDAGGELED